MTLPLFGYQGHAADIMATRDRYGLHDEMGIGKTATTIGAINRTLGERGLIICPAMLRENWIKEFKKFSTYDLRICKGKNIHDYIAWSRGRFDVLITSYEQATKWAKDFRKSGEYIDFVAFDEAHYLKNISAGRTMALLGRETEDMYGNHIFVDDGIVEFAEHAWHVTGTPMANDPLDVYSFLRFARAVDMSSAEFVGYFFEKRVTTYGARHFPKPEMVPTLQALIYNNAIRRTHKDVGMELPPIWLTELLIEGSTVEIEEALAGYPHLEKQIVAALETGNLKLLDAAHIATVRRLVGKAKAVPYAQMLKSELDMGAGKRVVFCVHVEPLLYVQRYLARYGYKAVVAYGDTHETDRIKAVEDFMNDPNTHVFIGNIRVAGVGLTLTESCEIDMLESDWSPAGNAQAIKRVHRYGQTQDVRARFITLAGSIDVAVNNIVAGKTASIAEIEGHSMTAAPLDVLTKQS